MSISYSKDTGHWDLSRMNPDETEQIVTLGIHYLNMVIGAAVINNKGVPNEFSFNTSKYN